MTLTFLASKILCLLADCYRRQKQEIDVKNEKNEGNKHAFFEKIEEKQGFF